ncbi:MAG TPA: undecaprenyl/decaprenyl-phosphate alpha-N-acetylglucosaminyl 1-phosphate transferase [Firmicutes bacterium]|nr:undecaprenyl/decaprenyl-phosphate alpha-N-acetylglucosaminyl 1-phosphate transferase [Bacillota bacterium]
MVIMAAFLVAYIATPSAGHLAAHMGMVAKPGYRRIHQKLIPQGAGVAIYLAFWLAVAIWHYGFKQSVAPHWLSLFTGSTLILILGLVDDKYELSPIWKLAGQLGVVTYVVLSGHCIEFVTNPLGGMIHVGRWGIPLTILWITAVINMVNLIDGLDGLAAGVSGIACLSLAIVALEAGRPEMVPITLMLAGAAFGFLPHNFNPARVFMGDTGAMFLGLMLGTITVDGALKGAAAIALTVPFLALGVPVFDTAFAIIRRLLTHRPIYKGDQQHLHHGLLAIGLTQRQSVLVLYGVSLFLGGMAFWSVDLPVKEGLWLFVSISILAVGAARRIGVLPPVYQHSHQHQ